MKKFILSHIRFAERNYLLTNLLAIATFSVTVLLCQLYCKKPIAINKQTQIGWLKQGDILLLISLPTLALNGWNVKKALLGLKDPRQSRIFKNLSKYGLITEELIPEIEAELEEAAPLEFRAHKIYLTESWLVYQTQFALKIIRYENIISIARNVTNYQVKSSTVSQSYSLVIRDRFGERYKINMTITDIHKIVKMILKKVPNVSIDYKEKRVDYGD